VPHPTFTMRERAAFPLSFSRTAKTIVDKVDFNSQPALLVPPDRLSYCETRSSAGLKAIAYCFQTVELQCTLLLQPSSNVGYGAVPFCLTRTVLTHTSPFSFALVYWPCAQFRRLKSHHLPHSNS
jgi:hypothetical protein